MTNDDVAIVRAKVEQVRRLSIAAGLQRAVLEELEARVMVAIIDRLARGPITNLGGYALVVARHELYAMRAEEERQGRVARQLSITLGQHIPVFEEIEEPAREPVERVRAAIEAAGGSIPMAAQTLGVSERTVRRAVQGSTISRRPRGGPRPGAGRKRAA